MEIVISSLIGVLLGMGITVWIYEAAERLARQRYQRRIDAVLAALERAVQRPEKGA